MRRTMWLGCLAAMAAFCTPAFGQPAGAPKVITGQVAASELELRGIHVDSDGAVQGTVFNNTRAVMKDVKLLVKHTWLWKNERHPGDDSPGRSGYVSIPGEIAPKSSAAFSYIPDPPLAMRTDGSFETTAAVQSFTQVGE